MIKDVHTNMDTSNLYTLRNALLKNHLGLENSVQSCVELD